MDLNMNMGIKLEYPIIGFERTNEYCFVAFRYFCGNKKFIFTFFDNTSSVAIFFIAFQSVGAIPTRHTKCSENHIQN